MDSSNYKLATNLIGIEGEGEIFMPNGMTAADVIRDEKRKKLNDAIAAKEQEFKDWEESKQASAEALKEDVEVMPYGSYLLISPHETNPYQKIQRDERSGLIIDTGGFAPEYKSNETGEIEEEEQFIKVGHVIEVGPDVKFVKPGDDVFYTIASQMIVPFYKFGWVTVAEQRVIAIVNSGLSKRKESYGK